jgi:hypothetical protein
MSIVCWWGASEKEMNKENVFIIGQMFVSFELGKKGDPLCPKQIDAPPVCTRTSTYDYTGKR